MSAQLISPTLLLAEDDSELSSLLSEYLQSEGFAVETTFDGLSAVERVRQRAYAALILDVQMPGQNGFDALRQIRTFSQIPVIMLTARGEAIDRIVGLELGADDYLPKPCNPRELSARLRAILRRSGQSMLEPNGDSCVAPSASDTLVIEDLRLCQSDRTVSVQQRLVDLTSAEFNVLAEMLLHAGDIVSKEQLCEKALGRKLTLYDRSTDMHISNLRRKLGPQPDGSQRIKTIRGQGYLYVRPQAS